MEVSSLQISKSVVDLSPRQTQESLLGEVVFGGGDVGPIESAGLLISFTPVHLSSSISRKLGIWKIVSQHSGRALHGAFREWVSDDIANRLCGYREVVREDLAAYLDLIFGYQGVVVLSAMSFGKTADVLAGLSMAREISSVDVFKQISDIPGMLAILPVNPFDDRVVHLKLRGDPAMITEIAKLSLSEFRGHDT